RLKQRGHDGLEIWMGRGDPMSAGSPFGMIGPCIRQASGVRPGEPLPVRREKLLERVQRHVAPKEVVRVAEFLGELTGTPISEDPSVQLRAARQEPTLMGDQMR